MLFLANLHAGLETYTTMEDTYTLYHDLLYLRKYLTAIAVEYLNRIKVKCQHYLLHL